MQHKAFASTSLGLETALQYTSVGGTLLRIKAPKGTYGLSVGSALGGYYDGHEGEVLLQRGYLMKVVDVKKIAKKGTSYDLVTVELIKPAKLDPVPR